MILLSLHFFALPINAKIQEKDTQNVKLEKGNSNKDNTYPRSLISIPMSCIYVDGTIQLTLFEEVGDLEITVINQTTGEQWTSTNCMIMETSTDKGTYLVQIITEDGILYYGTYTL